MTSTLNAGMGVAVRPREWFSPEEIGRMIGRTADCVRDWCRMGRIGARKRATGRGSYLAWEIHTDALAEYLDHGLRALSPDHEEA